jgi:hypothetical protein
MRRATVLSIYTAALIMSFLSDALGCVAATIAGEDWPQ